MFFGKEGFKELFFFLSVEGLPFLDDFLDEFRLSHSGELMSVLVVLLSGELPVEFGEVCLVKFTLHRVFGARK